MSETKREEVQRYRDAAIRRHVEDLLAVLETPEGRRVWLWIVYDKCGLNKRPPVGPLERFEGRRDVAVDLVDALRRFPEQLVQLERDRAELAADEFQFNARLQALEEAEKEGNEHAD